MVSKFLPSFIAIVLCLSFHAGAEPLSPLSVENEVLSGYNPLFDDDALKRVHDLESSAKIFGETLQAPLSTNDLFTPVVEYQHFRKLSDVMAKLHSTVEHETDIVYLVNTGTGNSPEMRYLENFIPAQHKRLEPQNPVRKRSSRPLGPSA